MTPKQVRESVSYWLVTARHDYDTMITLFQNKRYSDCLFFGHIILEKILKAHVVQVTKKPAPYIHDLVRLEQLAKLEFSSAAIHFLHQVNDFNIRARYPEHKLRFYKQCSKAYTEPYFDQIVKVYKKLCQELKLKK